MSSDCSIICGLPDPPWEAAGRDLPPAPQARVDGPDQGERGDRGVSRTVFVGLAHARTRNGPGPCLRWKGPKIFMGRC